MKNSIALSLMLVACTSAPPRENAGSSSVEDPSQLFHAREDGTPLVWKTGHSINAIRGCHTPFESCPPHRYYEVTAELSLDPAVAAFTESTVTVTLQWAYDANGSNVGVFACGPYSAGVDFAHLDSDEYYTTSYGAFGASLRSGASCTIDVTRFDSSAHGLIEGSFDAVLVVDPLDSGGDVAPFVAQYPVSGTFRIVRDD